MPYREVVLCNQRTEEKLALWLRASRLAFVEILWELSWAISGQFRGHFREHFRVHYCFFSGRFQGACQIFRGGLRGYKTNVYYFFELSWATKWPVRGAFRGLSGTPSGASPWAASEPCILKSQRFCGFPKAPLKPLSPQSANRIRRHWYNLVFLWSTAKNRNSPLSLAKTSITTQHHVDANTTLKSHLFSW